MGKGLEYTSLQRKYMNDQNAHEKIFNIIIRKMQIHTTMKYQFRPSRMTIIKKEDTKHCKNAEKLKSCRLFGKTVK